MLVQSFQAVALGALLLGQGSGIQGTGLPGPVPLVLDLLTGDDGIALIASFAEEEIDGHFELDATVRLPAGADHHVVHLVLPPPPPAIPVSTLGVSARAHPPD